MTEPLPNSPPPAPLPASPMTHPAIQAALDADHLRLLEIGFYISGIVTAFRFIWFAVLAVIFTLGGFGAAFAARHGRGASDQAPPAALFFVVAIIFGLIIFLTLVFAALEIYAGICLKNRRHPVLIQVVAAFYCISIPWGTALGVFTFMVLNRPTVKSLFGPS
jgi:hypothetical protein